MASKPNSDAPSPATREHAAEGVLTREEFELAVRGEYDQPGQLVRGAGDLLAHDAALRSALTTANAEVERLKTDLGNVCEMGVKDAARADTATRALREIAESVHVDSEGFIVPPCSCPVCVKRREIAAAALAEIEKWGK